MSSSDAAALPSDQPTPASFSLWPLPELRRGVDLGAGAVQAQVATPEEAAYDRGVADGKLAATQELRANLDQLTAVLRGVADELRTTKATCAREMEEQVFVLAMAVARQIIRREVDTDSSVVAEMVRGAMDAVSWEGPITVRLHPDDHVDVSRHFDELDPGARPPAVDWEPDPAVDRGGFLVETPHRLVDGRLETVLKNMHGHLVND